ncbi:MAG: hypothetical protein L0241_01570 [Planctomycetia bacterium]|nr:hypothetical protein [Planctomycetia bacterium]
MPALFFPNLDALRLALASGLVPAIVSQAPVRVACDNHGHLWLEPDEPLARESLAALVRLGVRVQGGSVIPTHPARCWAELLPLRRSETSSSGLVLFDVPDQLLAQFVARVRRLCHAPVGVRLLDEPYADRAWVTVNAPPTSVLLWAIESSEQPRVYREQAPNVWSAWGWEHPLASHLVVPSECVLLCTPEREVSCLPGPVPEPLLQEISLRSVQIGSQSPGSTSLIPVRLRLVADRTPRDETVWVLTKGEQEAFHDFCRTADERLLLRFQVATAGTGDEVRVLVRRATEDDGNAVLPLPCQGYQADPRVRSLFVPSGCALRPAIRASVLARELPLAADRLVWLESVSEGELSIHTVPLAAFQPLRARVEYVAPPRLALESDRLLDNPFAFARIAVQLDPVGTELEPEPDTHAEQEETPTTTPPAQPHWMVQSLARLLRWVSGRKRSARREEDQPNPRPPGHTNRASPRAAAGRNGERVERKLSSADALLHGHDRAVRRHDLEGQLLADFPKLDSDQRAERWAELAGVYGATGRSLDAAVCWVHAIWDCATPPEAWLEQWAVAECRAAKGGERGMDLERWLGEPARPGTGRVVAALSAMFGLRSTPPPEFISALPRVLAILDQQFDDIPLRGAWLARAAVAKSCDGDTLGLARWRDRLVRRLHDRGPGLDLDEPSFLRFRGTATPERFQTARGWLASVRKPVLEWVQNHAIGSGRLLWAGLDAEIEATKEYATLLLAWGLGALGERTLSRDWSAWARKSLGRLSGPGVDPAGHAALGDLFLHRIKDAHEGRSPKPGLPAELQERIDRLPEFARYSVDRLREHCRILEPLAHVRAYRGLDLKPFWGTDRLGERLSVLGAHSDTIQLNDEARALLAITAAEPTTSTVPRVGFALLDMATYLEPSVLTPLLELVPTILDWLETWLQAGRWTDEERTRRLTQFQSATIESAVAVAPAPEADQLLRYLVREVATGRLLPAVSAAAPRVFRTTRKYGLTAEADALIQVLDPARGEWGDTRAIPAERIGLAIGWFAAGDEEAGNRILNAARESLFVTKADDLRTRTRVALAYAEALGFAPAGIALGRLEEIFQRLDRLNVDSSTNRYYTLQPLRLIDTVVRSVVTDEFTLGATVRAWLDEDEFLIRRRIHREMAALLREQDAR